MDTKENYERILRLGREALEKGKVQNFPDAPEDLAARFRGTQNNLVFYVTFTAGCAKYMRKVALPIMQIGGLLGVKHLVAGMDYPLHGTVSQGTHREEDIAGFLNVWQGLHLGSYEGLLTGCEFVYDQLLFDERGNILLAATEIPLVIREARRELEKFLRLTGFSPTSMENIFHLTAARLASLPANLDQYAEYGQGLERLRQSILNAPLWLQVDTLVARSTLDLVTLWQ